MTAKEMFEELGYEQIRNDDSYIIYKNKGIVEYKICFCKNNNSVEIEPTRLGKIHYFVRLDSKLLKAINKQIEELGWDNEKL